MPGRPVPTQRPLARTSTAAMGLPPNAAGTFSAQTGAQRSRHWRPFGDAALVLQLADFVDETIHSEVVALTQAIRAANLGPDVAVVPAYSTIAVSFDPARRTATALARRLPTAASAAIAAGSATLHAIAVAYDGADLDAACAALGLEPQSLAALHCSQPYLVYATGFLPGFAYLGLLDPRLELPRRPAVRRLPAGAVVAAGRQTAILPAEGLTGWHHLGTTRFRPLDWSRSAPMALQVGDRVRFQRVPDGRPG